MIIAKLSGVKIQEETATVEQLKTKNVQIQCPSLTLPCLETEDGHFITSSLSIARYIANSSGKQELLGSTDFEKGQVDQWLYYLRSEVQPLARVIGYQVFGHIQTDLNEHTYIYG